MLRDHIAELSGFEELVGASAGLKRVLAAVEKVAATDSTVLILGETGTGKELVAAAIHRRSPRAAPMVKLNCAAIPEALVASELFGHERGAFTGALQRRIGRFEIADHSSLILDEVGELPLEAQEALLRVLQEREFERVGGTQTIRTDVRLIAATNRDLRHAVAEGGFFAPTCSIASTSSLSKCLPCASDAKTSRCWWNISWRAAENASGKPSNTFSGKPWLCWWRTSGRVTFASRT